MSPEMQRLLAERAARAAPPPIEPPDALLEALERAAWHFDRSWVPGQGIRPSSLKIIRYCALMTSRLDGAQEQAQSMARDWLREVQAAAA